MPRRFMLWPFLLLALSVPAAAEPIRLNLSFFTSDRELTFQAGIKPFIDAVNHEGHGLIRIETHTDGALGTSLAEQADLVLQGKVDIAFVNPALTPERFADHQVMRLPGMFRSVREAALVYNELIDSRAIRDLGDYVVVGAFVAYPLVLHTRASVTSLADLKGKKLRVSSPIEAQVLKRFGVAGNVTPITELARAIDSGALDGAVGPPGPFFEFGIARLVRSHYLLPLGAGPLLLLMNAQRFASLPAPAQEIIRRFSGAWLVERYLQHYEARTEVVLETLKTNPRRIVTEPSASDFAKAQQAFASANAEWVQAGPRHREIFTGLQRAIAAVRRGAHANMSNPDAANR
jgi:TRAP-type transport system periplasmic protein